MGDTSVGTIESVQGEDIRTGLGEESIRRAFLDNLFYLQGRVLSLASTDDKYKALAYTVRDRMLHRQVATVQSYQKNAEARYEPEVELAPHRPPEVSQRVGRGQCRQQVRPRSWSRNR